VPIDLLTHLVVKVEILAEMLEFLILSQEIMQDSQSLAWKSIGARKNPLLDPSVKMRVKTSY